MAENFDDTTVWSIDKLGKALLELIRLNAQNADELKELRCQVTENTARICQTETKLSNIEGHLEDNKMNKMEQRSIEKAIVLKGFKYDFDQTTIADSLFSLAKISGNIDKVYKFSKIVKSESTNQKYFYLFLSFCSYNDKKKLILYLKSNGNPTSEQLDSNCPEANIEDEILIDHALTLHNLNIKRKLLGIRKQLPKNSFSFRLRNGDFQFKMNKENKWITAVEETQIDTHFQKLFNARLKRDISISPSETQTNTKKNRTVTECK